MTKVRTLERQPAARLDTPTDLSDATVKEISAALNALLADAFALYLKTKNFHWRISGPHFRDYHLLLDQQAEQIFATTSVVPRCARSAISLGISRSKTTLLTSSRPTACCAS
jgi:starvation-inducible DNA-binding protein